MAALLTRRSMPPNASTAAAAIACVDSGDATSTRTKRAFFPISSATRRPCASFSSATTTRAPSAARALAYVSPMPCPAPVTIATLSWNRMRSPLGVHLDDVDAGAARLRRRPHDGGGDRLPVEHLHVAEEAPALPRVEDALEHLRPPREAELAARRPGADDDRTHPRPLDLAPERAGEALHARLGRRVADLEGPRLHSVHRRHEHEVARPAREHPRQHPPREEHRAEEIRPELSLEIVGRDLVQQARDADPGVAHDHVGRPERRLGGGHARVDRLGPRDVERMSEGPAALALDRTRHLRESVRSPRAERHDKAHRAERDRDRSPDAGGRAGDERRPHRSNSIGIDEHPRTFTEWMRFRPAGSISQPPSVECTSSSATRLSSRASAAPRQKWRPCPKDSMSLVSRRTSKRSASGKTRSSRLPEPTSSTTRSPAFSRSPCSSTSAVSVRASACVEPS